MANHTAIVQIVQTIVIAVANVETEQYQNAPQLPSKTFPVIANHHPRQNQLPIQR